MNNTYKITFNMPGEPGMTQSLVIKSKDNESAIIDAGYIARGYKLEVLSMEEKTHPVWFDTDFAL